MLALNNMIYLAPIQGFTDYIYRKVYSGIFNSVDAYFIPYVTVQNEKIVRKYEREILPGNNLYGRAIPQILVSDARETELLTSVLKSYGYAEVNLNLGCPYPMVTNRGRGSALLLHPEKLRPILDTFFNQFKLKLSVKIRAGLNDPEEIEKVISVLNDYPLSEIIVHARVARQLYKGTINDAAFKLALEQSEHPVVFNGDIFSLEDFESRSEQFSAVSDWMLGRGVLMNVFLPAEIKGWRFTDPEKRFTLQHFHTGIVEAYLQTSDNPGNALNKIKQFWIYFGHHFDDQARIFKKIKKSKNITDVQREAMLAFRDATLRQTI